MGQYSQTPLPNPAATREPARLFRKRAYNLCRNVQEEYRGYEGQGKHKDDERVSVVDQVKLGQEDRLRNNNKEVSF